MTDLNALLKMDDDVEKDTDFIGGGGYLKESGVYLMKVLHAYIQESSGGATGVHMTLKHTKDNGESEFNTTIYVTSGTAKGKKAHYIHPKTGAKVALPGYTTVNDMCLIASGKVIAESTTSTKTVEVYDFDQRKPVNKEVEVLDVLTGAVLQIGMDKMLVNKFSNGAPIAETTEKNEISKVFNESGQTVNEIEANAAPEFIEKWKLKHDGVTLDKTTVKAAPASSHSAEGAPAASADNTAGLFD